MKKTKLLRIVVAVLLCVLLVFAACKPDEEEKPTVEVKLNHSTYSLDLHEQVQLTATITNSEEKASWASSNTAVATVDGNGLVKSVKAGKTTVTATVGEVSASCEVTVTNSGAAPLLEVDHEKIGVNKNAEVTVNAVLKYKGQTVTESVTINWTVATTPQGIISVTPSSDGKSAVVKGLEYGETSFDVSAVLWGTPLKQTVQVKVCNTDISFEVKNQDYELAEGGYNASLALVATDDYAVSTTPDITVKDKGSVVSDAQITWTPDKADVVSVQDGVITALKAGKVVLTGEYEHNTVKLFIDVIRPTIELSKVTIETSVAKLVLAENDSIVGTISAITFGDDDTNVFDKVEDEQIILKASALPRSAVNLGENKTVTVDTDKASYVIPADIYTKVLKTKEDLAGWGDLAKAADDNAKLWDGYFVLGNDIDFEGATYNSFICWENTQTLQCTEAGFKGVFDGKGHIIDDIVIDNKPGGGFIGMMYTADGSTTYGVLNNVAFTNLVTGGNNGAIVSTGGGKVSNVYVSCNLLKSGGSPDRSGFFFTRDAQGWAARVSNCFIEIKEVEANSNTFAIGSKHRRTGMISGVYAVGYDKAFFELSETEWDNPADVYGAYADYASFLDADVDFSTWDTDFWKIVNGIPYPKNLDESLIPEIERANLSATVTAANVLDGSSVDLVGKTVKLVGINGSYEAEITSSGIAVENVVKGSYTVSIDGFTTSTVNFDGEALQIELQYVGEVVEPVITTENYSFWGTNATVSKGEMTLSEQYGQYQVAFGGQRQNHVLTKGSYGNVSVSAMFSSSYGAWDNTLGIMLKFADGKGILLGFQNQGGIGGSNFKLTYRTDNETYKFGMTDTLTGWIGDNGELTDCKPMKAEWKDKFDTARGLKLTLVRNGNVLLTYVDDVLVNVYALDEAYATSQCQIGFFSNWGDCNIPFAISNELKAINVSASGLDSLENGTATLNAQSYKLGDAIILNVTPTGNYKAIKVLVNGQDKTSALKADGTLLLGYATEDVTYAIAITFDEPVTLAATVDALKAGANVDLKGKTVTLVGSNGTFSGVVGDDGALSVPDAYRGAYTAKLEGYLDASVTFDGTASATIHFEYDRFEGSGVYDVAKQNKTDSVISFGKQDQAWAITKDKYDNVSVTATFKSSYGSYKGFMGIQLVFDDGNGVMLTFECTVNNDTGVIDPTNMKLCFGTDCWQKKFAISGNALTSWVSVSEPLAAEMAAAFASNDGLEITLVRNGNYLAVLYGGNVLKSVTIGESYADKQCRVAFHTCWGECDIPFAISEELPDAGHTVTANGLDALENGSASLNKTSGWKLGDAVVLNITPNGDYRAIKVLVNGKDKTESLKNGKLFLDYIVNEDLSYEISISFDAPATLTATVSGLKDGQSVDFKGQTVTIVGINGTFTAVVGEDGTVTFENAYKGVYTVKIDNYIDQTKVEFGAETVELAFEYDRFEGSGGYDLTNQNKADASVKVGGQQHNYVLTKDKYGDVSVTASFKASNGSYKAFSGIQLVFDDGNGVMVVFECSQNSAVANKTKLGFGTDCWGAKYAITGEALHGWDNAINEGDLPAAFDSDDGLEITVKRQGNSVSIIVGQTVKTITIDEKYTDAQCRVAFYSEWGNATIPFEITETPEQGA